MSTKKAKMRKLKVYGGLDFRRIEKRLAQVRTIVATTSWRRASELTGLSLYELQTYWAISGNERELGIALSCPETVFIKINDTYIKRDEYAETKRIA